MTWGAFLGIRIEVLVSVQLADVSELMVVVRTEAWSAHSTVCVFQRLEREPMDIRIVRKPEANRD